MPTADAVFTWTDGIVAFGVLASIAFLVSWLSTDIFHVARNGYIAILSSVVALLTAACLAWSGASGMELVTSNWRGGLVAGALVTIAIVPMIRRLPARAHPRGPRLWAMFAWEGVVYGTAEALLLAALPVLVVWDATGVGHGGAWRGVLAIVGALVVILVHHLGYTEFRTIAARPKLLGALVSCGLQAGAFLLTGNVLAPIAAHIALHVTLILRGVEMPPAVEPSAEAPPRVMPDREGLVTTLPQARSSDGRR